MNGLITACAIILMALATGCATVDAVPTGVMTATPSPIQTFTPVATSTSTATAIATNTPTSSATPTSTATATATAPPTATVTPTLTPTATPTKVPPTATATATVKPTLTPTAVGEKAEIIPELEGKVQGTFTYFVDSGWLYVKVGVLNLDANKTIVQWTMEYWLTSNYKPYKFSTWTTPTGAIRVAPGRNLPPFLGFEGKWDLSTWNKERLGSDYPEGLAQAVLADQSAKTWKINVKFINVVYQ